MSNNSKNPNVSMDTIPEVNVSDFADVNTNIEHVDMCNNTSLHETLDEDSIRNMMLTEYNKIVIGSFKEFFQLVDTNNLSEVLQAYELMNFMNFIILNTALLELCGLSTALNNYN